MSNDMTVDVFADMTFGKLALQKIAHSNPLFRLYKAGWLGEGKEREVMEVAGAVFRHVQRGPNKGQLTIMVPGTKRTVHVTSHEMGVFDAAEKSAALADAAQAVPTL